MPFKRNLGCKSDFCGIYNFKGQKALVLGKSNLGCGVGLYAQFIVNVLSYGHRGGIYEGLRLGLRKCHGAKKHSQYVDPCFTHGF